MQPFRAVVSKEAGEVSGNMLLHVLTKVSGFYSEKSPCMYHLVLG